jgi:hypothetical protein
VIHGDLNALIGKEPTVPYTAVPPHPHTTTQKEGEKRRNNVSKEGDGKEDTEGREG